MQHSDSSDPINLGVLGRRYGVSANAIEDLAAGVVLAHAMVS
jgi:hypothetical protein